MFTDVSAYFYFFVCLTSNKLYWIEDQLADVSTRFYTLASWRRQVGPSASWLVTSVATTNKFSNLIHKIVSISFYWFFLYFFHQR